MSLIPSWAFALRDCLPFFNRKPPMIYRRSPLKHDHFEYCSDCERKMWPGEWVYWDEPSYEYGETDPYCRGCTQRDQDVHDSIDWEAEARRQ